jgi:enediyne biosynthesis protein E3
VSATREMGGDMAGVWSSYAIHPLRRFLSLSPDEASFRKRGFLETDREKRLTLEAAGEAFIGGYNAALAADRVDDALRHIDTVSPLRRGFAAEGAAMGFAIADALPFQQPRLPEYIRASECEFSYLTHVGAGWALARVPWRRARILAPLDPVHHWLAFDGLGFHDAYFYHRHTLGGWRRLRTGYASHVYDQGIGRALWFVSGGSVAAATRLIAGFPSRRQSDLWSGLGLAMAYAGPANGDEIDEANGNAGEFRPLFALGVAFACEARALARHIPAYTDLAARIVSGASAEALSALTRDVRKNLPATDADAPPYEIWQCRVAAAMTPMLERRSW